MELMIEGQVIWHLVNGINVSNSLIEVSLSLLRSLNTCTASPLAENNNKTNL